MATYTYLFGDLRTGSILGELPLDDVKFSSELKGAGSWSASLALGDARVRALEPIALTRPGRAALYIDRDGTLVGGGPVWTRRFATDGDDAGKLMLAGNGWLSYLAHRHIRSNLVFVDADQAQIVAEILYHLADQPGGDIGIAVVAPPSGVLRDRTYYGYERKLAGEAIQQLAEVGDGFDFVLEVAWDDDGAPVKTLVVAYPRLGVQAFETPLMFDRPGNIVGFDWPEDATRMANLSDAIGVGEGDDMLIATSVRGDMLDGGYALFEQVASYKDVRVYSTLVEHADADVDAAAAPVTIPTLTVLGDADPVVGTYRPGDDCRIAITADRFPGGLDTYGRIVGFTVEPANDEHVETVHIDLGEVTE